MQYLLMCRSLTYAQRGARVLERSGITAAVSRAPKGLSVHGCGYCITVPERYYSRAKTVLAGAGLEPERVYRRLADGSTEEVPR